MIEFNFHDDNLGELIVEVEGHVYKSEVEDFSELGYHFEHFVDNLNCMVYKDKECIHPNNIDKEVLKEIYSEAEMMLITNFIGG